MATTIKVRVKTFEEMLGTASANQDLHEEFIASKAPDAKSREEEVAAIGAEEVFEKGMTVFPRDEDGKPIAWNYQWEGFFKDACGAMRDVPGSKCSAIKAYKKKIDQHVFVFPRQIPIQFDGEIGICQRPLRAQTAKGERVALTSSESIPAGAVMEFEIKLLVPAMEKAVLEMLDYGELRGFGQWRNSGKGRFKYEVIETIRDKKDKAEEEEAS